MTRPDNRHLTTLGTNFKLLRLERAAARTHNVSLNEILKMGALTAIRRAVLPTNNGGYTYSHVSNPPFLKHR